MAQPPVPRPNGVPTGPSAPNRPTTSFPDPNGNVTTYCPPPEPATQPQRTTAASGGPAYRPKVLPQPSAPRPPSQAQSTRQAMSEQQKRESFRVNEERQKLIQKAPGQGQANANGSGNGNGGGSVGNGGVGNGQAHHRPPHQQQQQTGPMHQHSLRAAQGQQGTQAPPQPLRRPSQLASASPMAAQHGGRISPGQGQEQPRIQTPVQGQGQARGQLASTAATVPPEVLAALNRIGPRPAQTSAKASPSPLVGHTAPSGGTGGSSGGGRTRVASVALPSRVTAPTFQPENLPWQQSGQAQNFPQYLPSQQQQQQLQQQPQQRQYYSQPRQIHQDPSTFAGQQQINQNQYMATVASQAQPNVTSQQVADAFANMRPEQLASLQALANQIAMGGMGMPQTGQEMAQGGSSGASGSPVVGSGVPRTIQQETPVQQAGIITPSAPPIQTAPMKVPKLPIRVLDAAEEEHILKNIKTDDDEEYYDELSEEEASDVPPATPTSSVNQMKIDQGILGGCLNPYNESRQTCKSLDELIQYGDIELEPDYQREVVWPEARQSGLIDSLFRGVYVPPVLFAIRITEEGNESRVCIDGKQRLTSISLFMQGQIPWIPTAGTHEGKRLWYKVPRARSHGIQLSPNLIKQFNMKLVTVAEFRDLPDEIERDIFQRVQLGMALSPAEKLRAMDTPYVRYVHALLNKHINGHEGFVHYYKNWERSRGRDFQNVGTVCMLLEAYPNEKHHVSAQPLKTFLTRADNPERNLRKRIDRAFDLYLEIVKHHQAAALQTVPAKLSPVEFCFIPLVLDEFHQAPIDAIARMIGKMRVHIRTVEKDVRSNAPTLRALYQWLFSQPKIREKRPREDEDDDETPSDEGMPHKRRQLRQESEELDGDFVSSGVTASQLRTARATRRTG